MALACSSGRAPEPVATLAASEPAPAEPTHFALRGATLLGVGRVDLEVRDGIVAAIGAVAPELPEVDLAGRWIVPAAIDSHVHLSYLPGGRRLLASGVAAVVDLAAPLPALRSSDVPAALQVVASGPMLTAPGGYPTRDWGADGYGLEVDDAEAGDAVDRLADAGARVIKVAVTDPPALGPRALRAIVARAHARGLKVVAHALLDRHARAAGEAGVDVLAHTPVEPLQPKTVALWSGRAVISTLAAFGGRPETLDNLARLRAAGATVVYGTDLGNTQNPAIDPDELELLRGAGLSGQEIVAALTGAPARLWGLEGAGSLEVGAPASFLVLAADPLQSPLALAAPEAVYVAGARQP